MLCDFSDALGGNGAPRFLFLHGVCGFAKVGDIPKIY